MPVDKFGRMSDTKTKDTGVSLTYINNNYVRSDGGTPLTGSLDMKGNTIYNVADPVNPQDVVTKVYVDNTKGSGVIGRKIGDAVSIKENLDFLGKQKIKNLVNPVNDKDAVTKEYVDNLQTQYIDKRGNVKFDRNINVGNNRIFALKDPKKDYEATNKKYVDESITKRLEEEKDKFLPQDPATKNYVDEAIKGLAGGDLLVSKEGVFIKANGHYRATAPLDIDNHKMKNLPDPVDEKDAANKKYIDEIVENLTLKQGLIRENGGFNLVDSYINMNFHNIRNVGLPKHEADAVPRKFVDDMIKEVEEKINKRKQLIAVHARYCGPLKEGEYPFKFNGANFENCEEILEGYKDFKGSITGFVMPHSGYIKKIICEYLSFRSFESVLNFFFKFLSDYKKEAVITDFPVLERAGYVDIEDVLTKGIDEFNKIMRKEKVFTIVKNEIKLEVSNSEKFGFHLVKFEKSFDSKDYPTIETPPKIISSVLFAEMKVKHLNFTREKLGLGTISRFSKNDYITISEGDVINIKSNFSIAEVSLPHFNGSNIEKIFEIKYNKFFNDGLNFNFTFLIELDPL